MSTVSLPIVAACEWVYRSGWAKGERCGSDAWTAVDGSPQCPKHLRVVTREAEAAHRPCARYWGSDETLCSTHHGRFASPSENRCSEAEAAHREPDGRLIDTRPKIGDLVETIELEIGMHNPVGAMYECDCGDQIKGETFNHHVAAALDYRLTATDGDA